MRQFNNIWLPGALFGLDISPYSQEHNRWFSPGLGRSPNLGLAGDSKPRVAPSSLAQVDGPVHGLSAGGLEGGQLSKAGGRGGCLVRVPPLS